MKPHVKLYIKTFNCDSFIACECCGSKATDIHHIECRGMGGAKTKDTITNLMALCRDCHIKYGDRKPYKEYLQRIHLMKLAWAEKT